MDGTPFGRYRLLDLLGRGGMGEVWRAFDTVTERVVAIKVLPTQFADDAVYQERFRREARSAAGLDEPHVVPIHDFGEIDGRLFVTMRLIKGRDLHGIISDGRLASARAVGIIDQVASALQAAHEIDLVHRDVKPSNILVGKDDFAYLIDFGIARAAGQSGLTSASSVVGTWAYMAPERVTAGKTDARSDVYALACVLYECLTGRQPFPGDSLEQQIGGHIAMPPPSASDRHADVPAGLDAVIAKGMAKDPDERYSSARELAHAAKLAVTGPLPRPAPPPTTPAPFVNPYAAPEPTPAHRPEYEPGPPSPPNGTPRYRPERSDPNQLVPKRSRKGLVIGLAAAVVVAVVAVVSTVVLSDSSGQSATPTTSSPIATTPPPPQSSEPFTGTFTADFGQSILWDGIPTDTDPPPFTETWQVRSACGGNGCVATASSGGTYASKDVVFDKVGDAWVGVSISSRECLGVDPDEAWNVITLRPQPDGTLTGEMTQTTTNSCFNRRTLTFTRTGDTDVSLLPDPASLPPRVVSPAEALYGQYDEAFSFEGRTPRNFHNGVRTTCLRGGDRCASALIDTGPNGGVETFVFANGTWTRNDFDDSHCPGGNRSTMTMPLPQPPENPIAVLTGHGYRESTGSGCLTAGNIADTFTRTGD